MVTEEEMRERLSKLSEAKALQEKKTEAANEALTKARERCNKEKAKLENINAEINRIDGFLFRKLTLEFGFRDHEELEKYLISTKKEKASKEGNSFVEKETGNETESTTT